VEQILFISDTHFGAPDVSGDIMLSKLEGFKHDIASSCLRLPTKIVFGGDMVEGEEIYPTQTAEVDYTANRQMRQAFNALSELIRYVSVMSPQPVKVYGVEGNHGRLNKRNYGNLDGILYMMLDNAFPDIEFTYAEKREPLFFESEGLKFLVVHGDGIRTYANIPFYGISRRVMAWSQVHDFDGVLLGHFHSLHYHRVGKKHVFINGTWHVDSRYSFRMGLIPSGEQWCIWTDKGRLKGFVPLSVPEI